MMVKVSLLGSVCNYLHSNAVNESIKSLSITTKYVTFCVHLQRL